MFYAISRSRAGTRAVRRLRKPATIVDRILPQAGSFSQEGRGVHQFGGTEGPNELAGCEREQQDRPMFFWREQADAHQAGGRVPRVQQLATEGGLGRARARTCCGKPVRGPCPRLCCRFHCDLKNGCQDERQRSVHRCSAWVVFSLVLKCLALCTRATAGFQWPGHLDGHQFSLHLRFTGKCAFVSNSQQAHWNQALLSPRFRARKCSMVLTKILHQ